MERKTSDLERIVDDVASRLAFAGIDPDGVYIRARAKYDEVWIEARVRGIDFRLESALEGIAENNGYEMNTIEDGLFSVSAN